METLSKGKKSSHLARHIYSPAPSFSAASFNMSGQYFEAFQSGAGGEQGRTAPSPALR